MNPPVALHRAALAYAKHLVSSLRTANTEPFSVVRNDAKGVCLSGMCFIVTRCEEARTGRPAQKAPFHGTSEPFPKRFCIIRVNTRILNMVRSMIAILALSAGSFVSAEEDNLTLEQAMALHEARRCGEISKHRKKLKEQLDKIEIRRLQDLQNRGNHAHFIGKMFKSGCGAPQNFGEALTMFRSAAPHHVPAQTSLGEMYEKGLGVAMNLKTAENWYYRSARQGDTYAQFRLGFMYYEEVKNSPESADIACEKNSEKCIESYKWINIAASNSVGKLHGDIAKIRDEISGWIRDSMPDLLAIAQQRSYDWIPQEWNPNGSGFYITDNLILTNTHVVRDCDNVSIQGAGDSEITDAEIIAMEHIPDLALLEVISRRTVNRYAIFPRDDYDLKLGEEIMVLGYPAPGIIIPILASEPNVTRGNVSAVAASDLLRNTNQFQFTAPIQGGNSGGPVLNKEGLVVGVVFASRRGLQNVNYAVSLGAIREFLQKYDLMDEAGRSAPSTVATDFTQIALSAREYTVLVDCWIDLDDA